MYRKKFRGLISKGTANYCTKNAFLSVVFSSLNFERASIVLHKLFRRTNFSSPFAAPSPLSKSVEIEAGEISASRKATSTSGISDNWSSMKNQLRTFAKSLPFVKESETVAAAPAAILHSHPATSASQDKNASLDSPHLMGTSQINTHSTATSSANDSLLQVLSPLNVSRQERLFLPARQGEGIIKTWSSLRLPLSTVSPEQIIRQVRELFHAHKVSTNSSIHKHRFLVIVRAKV